MKKRGIVFATIFVMCVSLMPACDKQPEYVNTEFLSGSENKVDSDLMAQTEVEERTQKEEAEKKQMEEERKRVEDERIKAEEQAKKAEEERLKVEAEAQKAEEERVKAEEEAKKAEEERLKAEAEAQKAEEERLKAEEETKRAEAEARRLEEERLKAEAEAKKAEEERLKAEAEAKKLEEERLMAEAEEKEELTPTQLTSLSMLNYMTVLTQKINNSRGNQLFLEAARTSLYNDTNLKAVDTKTQAQIKQLAATIDEYCMVSEKRNRLQFIYEQNQAQALRQAIPNPMGLLSAVQSGSLLKAAASVVYMTVDSVNSYKTATSQAELSFIKEGWELDDEEIKALQNSTTAQFDYMCNMTRAYNLPDEYVVRDTDVKAFVEWSSKTSLESKILWLQSNQSTYQKFGPYWLELVQDYYEAEDYQNCIYAINQYENISAKITRKDGDYANALPMVIIASKEILPKDDYIKTAREYCTAIRNNTKDEDWTLRYFTAQIYLDLYAITNNKNDLENAYNIALYNVNTLIEEQRTLNSAYIEPIKTVEAKKGATKRKKEEIAQYNKLLKEERKTAVPPVSEALYLNCELLFALAEKKGISEGEKNTIEALLHENGEDLFLTKVLDNRFRKNKSPIISSDLEVSFDGGELTIPVMCYSDRSKLEVSITGSSSEVLDDWVITEVTRPKNSDLNDYMVTFKSEKGKKHKYQAGDTIVIKVTPVEETPNEVVTFTFEVIAVKKIFVFNGIEFERK